MRFNLDFSRFRGLARALGYFALGLLLTFVMALIISTVWANQARLPLLWAKLQEPIWWITAVSILLSALIMWLAWWLPRRNVSRSVSPRPRRWPAWINLRGWMGGIRSAGAKVLGRIWSWIVFPWKAAQRRWRTWRSNRPAATVTSPNVRRFRFLPGLFLVVAIVLWTLVILSSYLHRVETMWLIVVASIATLAWIIAGHRRWIGWKLLGLFLIALIGGVGYWVVTSKVTLTGSLGTVIAALGIAVLFVVGLGFLLAMPIRSYGKKKEGGKKSRKKARAEGAAPKSDVSSAPFWIMVLITFACAGMFFAPYFFGDRPSGWWWLWIILPLVAWIFCFWAATVDAMQKCPSGQTREQAIANSGAGMLFWIAVLFFGFFLLGSWLYYEKQWTKVISPVVTEDVNPRFINRGPIQFVLAGAAQAVEGPFNMVFPQKNPRKLELKVAESTPRNVGPFRQPLEPDSIVSPDPNTRLVYFKASPGRYRTNLGPDLSREGWKVVATDSIYTQAGMRRCVYGKPYMEEPLKPENLIPEQSFLKPYYPRVDRPEGGLLVWQGDRKPEHIKEGQVLHRPLGVLRLIAWIPVFRPTQDEIYIGINVPQTTLAAGVLKDQIVVRLQRVI